MKSQPMKLCTIIYDGPALAGVFSRYAPGEAAHLMTMHLFDMKIAVEQAAQRLRTPATTLFWTEPGIHPLRLSFFCPDHIAENLRLELLDQYIIELDHP